jgi:hypothetical protein
LTLLAYVLNNHGVAAETVICTYRVMPGQEEAFVDLLRRHWPTLHSLGVVTDEPAQIFRSLDTPTTFVEIFTWADAGYLRAREHPDVLAIWEPMEQLCEERDGRPSMEFPHFETVLLHA